VVGEADRANEALLVLRLDLLVPGLVLAQALEADLPSRAHREQLAAPQARALAVRVDLALAAVTVLLRRVLERLRARRACD